MGISICVLRDLLNCNQMLLLLQLKSKGYEFAYAVKDGHHGDDFFHKERRQGKKTVGEYRVLLPDGRTQVS